MELSVNNLSKQIMHTQIFHDVHFNWQPGEIIGLVGQNGAGKTTLMRTLVHQYVPDSGAVLIDDKDTVEHPKMRQNIIFIDPTTTFFGRYTLRQLAEFYAIAYPRFDRPRYNQLLKDYHLSPFKHYSELSKGYRALIVVFLSLCVNTPFVILDEPFDGLDLFVREAIVNLVIGETANGSRGFLIASHNLIELDGIADRILFLRHETISHDYTLESIREHAVKLQLVFPQHTIPDVIHDHGQIITIQGRVIEALFKTYTPEIEAELKALKPVLMEPLPVTLTDIFRTEFNHQERNAIYE